MILILLLSLCQVSLSVRNTTHVNISTFRFEVTNLSIFTNCGPILETRPYQIRNRKDVILHPTYEASWIEELFIATIYREENSWSKGLFIHPTHKGEVSHSMELIIYPDIDYTKKTLTQNKDIIRLTQNKEVITQGKKVITQNTDINVTKGVITTNPVISQNTKTNITKEAITQNKNLNRTKNMITRNNVTTQNKETLTQNNDTKELLASTPMKHPIQAIFKRKRLIKV